MNSNGKSRFKTLAAKAPVVSTFIFMLADCSQIYRMVQEQTAAGQSLYGWLAILVALAMYAVFFKVITPEEKLPLYCTYINIVTIVALAFTVVYFRYIR
jgi:hypothetical protein